MQLFYAHCLRLRCHGKNCGAVGSGAHLIPSQYSNVVNAAGDETLDSRCQLTGCLSNATVVESFLLVQFHLVLLNGAAPVGS